MDTVIVFPLPIWADMSTDAAFSVITGFDIFKAYDVWLALISFTKAYWILWEKTAISVVLGSAASFPAV